MRGVGELATKKKREDKITKVKTDAGVQKAAAKAQKKSIKRRRRDLLKKGVKYEV